MSRKLLSILAVVMAVAATAVVPAMASAVTLDNAEGEALPVGAPVTALSNNLVFTGSNGVNFGCGYNHLEGEVIANGGASATVEVTEGTFQASASKGPCETNLTPVNGLTIDVTALNLPWTIHFEAGGKSTITDVAFTFTLTVPNGVGGVVSVGHCTYTSTPIPDTYEFNVPLIDVIPGKSGATFTLTEGTENCPTSLTLHGSFPVTSAGGPVIATE